MILQGWNTGTAWKDVISNGMNKKEIIGKAAVAIPIVLGIILMLSSLYFRSGDPRRLMLMQAAGFCLIVLGLVGRLIEIHILKKFSKTVRIIYSLVIVAVTLYFVYYFAY